MLLSLLLLPARGFSGSSKYRRRFGFPAELLKTAYSEFGSALVGPGQVLEKSIDRIAVA